MRTERTVAQEPCWLPFGQVAHLETATAAASQRTRERPAAPISLPKSDIGEFTRQPVPARPARDLGELTEREREVLTLIGLGLSNTEICERLYVSMSTTKTHIGRLLMKLGARDRAQLVIAAYEAGLVRPARPR